MVFASGPPPPTPCTCRRVFQQLGPPQPPPAARRLSASGAFFLPDRDYADRFVHGSRGQGPRAQPHRPARPRARLHPPVIYEPQNQQLLQPVLAAASALYMQHAVPVVDAGLRIYEAHVGHGPGGARVGTYREFADHILPRIAAGGLHTPCSFMAIRSHPLLRVLRLPR